MTVDVKNGAGPFLNTAMTPAAASQVMSGLMRSVEPAVVMSSLARSCVPVFSDACTVKLSEGVQTSFRVTFPMEDDQPNPAATQTVGVLSEGLVAGNSVSTSFHGRAILGHASFAGIVVHFWDARRPSNEDAVIAQILVDHAVAVAHSQRLEQAAAQAEDRATKLALEAMSTRIIGEAMGVLMTSCEIAEEAAWILLRSMVRDTGRSLSQVCTDLVRRGALGVRSQTSRYNGLNHAATEGIGRGGLYSVSASGR